MRENGEPSVTLFVVHWNRPMECIATVRSLLAQGINLAVTVIDNNSAPESVRALEAGVNSETQIIKLTENKGWGPALNVALRNWLEVDKNPYCLISAHDAGPAPDCIALLLEAARKDERIGILCPQYPDQTVARLSALRGVYQDCGRALERGGSQLIDVPHGTLMLLRRACLAEIGLFDERYFAYGDEHELGARAARRGWKVAMVWGAIVTNPGTWTPSPLRSYLFTRNSLLLVHDYFGRPAAFLRAILILVQTLRLLTAPADPAFAFSAKARWRGVWHYVIGRYGPPLADRE